MSISLSFPHRYHSTAEVCTATDHRMSTVSAGLEGR